MKNDEAAKDSEATEKTDEETLKETTKIGRRANETKKRSGSPDNGGNSELRRPGTKSRKKEENGQMQ